MPAAHPQATISQGHTRSDSYSWQTSDSRPRRVLDQHAKLTPGSVIPDTHLEIVRWLGQGGTGMVFEVRHLDIDRQFAAKLLFRSESTARARGFRREARTIGRIGSPWIVEIFDFKELADGRLMYLMELVDGPSLLERLRELGKFELDQLISLARQICKGLADAHAHGFIHRDIKLENVMLATDPDGREHVKIVDFGLAGMLAEPNETSRAGTPAYMSPEQCKGEPADARADIYSLGVVIYELACGRLPFVSDDPDALLHDHVHTLPDPPSAVAGRALPPSFDALVMRCLAKHPEDRFANAAELEAALVELQLDQGLRTDWDDLPAPAVVEPRRRRLEQGLARLRRDHQRDRWRRALACVGLLAIIGLSTGLGWLAGADSRAAALAKANAEVAALSRDAKTAAAEQHWVYPSVDNPDMETAYRLLLELEAVDVDDAERLGQELREKFAASLLWLGDSYWDRPGGRAFAREFYAQVLMFDGDNQLALERSGLSPIGSLRLRQRAARGEFERYELVAVEPLVALAEPDPRTRLDRLEELASNFDDYPATVGNSLGLLIEDMERSAPAEISPVRLNLDVQGSATAASISQPVVVETLEPSSEPPVDPTTDAPHDTSTPTPKSQVANASEAKPNTDKVGVDEREAAELAEQGKHAYRTGNPFEAERLYRAALDLDAENLAALVGLHHIHFDRGEYPEALDTVERAATLRPSRGDLQLLVGDSCMKIENYTCARVRYERAAELGDKRASQRLRVLGERSSKKGAKP
jgi:tetratricopeptide (TPR) repeat protein